MPTVAVVLLRSTTRQHAGRCRLLPVILQPSIHTTTRLKARKCRLWGLLGSVLFGCRPVGRRDLGLSILQNGTCNPGDYGDDGVLNNIQADGAVPIIGFGGGANIPASWEARCQPPSGPTIPCSDTEFQNILIGGLQHLATAFPAITLIHDANEPDCNGGGNGCDNGAFQMSTIVQLSHDIAVAVNTVNAQLGTKHFLHGGPDPAFCQFFDMDSFVAGLVAAGTPPDFISYHIYPQTDLMDCVNKVKSALSNHGLDPNLLQICTECSTTGAIAGTAQQAA